MVTRAVEMPWASSDGLGVTVDWAMTVEGLHHAVDRAQQAEHRADRADQRDVAEPVLELHVLFFADFLHGLDGLRVAAG